MKIFKNKYGDSLCCVDTDRQGNKNKYYINIGYKKGVTLPSNNHKVEFIMKTSDGKEHECFFSCKKKKDGTIEPVLVVLS